MKILSVDPGLAGTGWAVFETKNKKLLNFGVIRNSKEVEWEARGLVICQGLELVQKELWTARTYIEFPSLFQSSHGQMVARKGDLVKLAWFTGMLYGRLEEPELVPVNQWKGQLPKAVVERRLRDKLGRQMSTAKSHAIDAIGIGCYIMGTF